MPKPPSITRIGLRGREFLAVEVGGTEHLRGPFCVKDFSDSIFPDQNFVTEAKLDIQSTLPGKKIISAAVASLRGIP